MKIIPGPASKELAEKTAQLLKTKAVPVFFKIFPDGESYVRYETESLENEEVAIIQTTSPPQDQRLLQLFLMADNASDMKAKSITVVVPYFAYSRQDKRFMSGEAFSVKTIMKLMKNCGINRIVTVNTHNPALLKTFSLRVDDLSAIPILAEYFLKEHLVQNPISLSLGKKGFSVAEEADRVLRGGADYISTSRDVRTGNVTLEVKQLPVRYRDVVIFDDIISSGGTMAKAVKFMKAQGASKVYVACVHPLLTGDSMKRIKENGAEQIIGTDCVPSPVSNVSVASLIAEALSS